LSFLPGVIKVNPQSIDKIIRRSSSLSTLAFLVNEAGVILAGGFTSFKVNKNYRFVGRSVHVAMMALSPSIPCSREPIPAFTKPRKADAIAFFQTSVQCVANSP